MKKLITALLAALVLLSAAPAIVTAASADLTDTQLAASTPDELLQQWLQIGALLRQNGSYPFTELEHGNTGYEVTALQTRLAELGYYQKEIVDYFGNGTYNAMMEFEKANGLKVNGVASAADQQALFSSAAIAKGGQSTVVTASISRRSDDDDDDDARTAPDATSAATGKP